MNRGRTFTCRTEREPGLVLRTQQALCAFGALIPYIFLHVVGHLGQVSRAIANFFLHIHHNHSGIWVVLQNRVRVLQFGFDKEKYISTLLTYLNILHQVLAEVFVALVNGLSDGTAAREEFITAKFLRCRC